MRGEGCDSLSEAKVKMTTEGKEGGASQLSRGVSGRRGQGQCCPLPIKDNHFSDIASNFAASLLVPKALIRCCIACHTVGKVLANFVVCG